MREVRMAAVPGDRLGARIQPPPELESKPLRERTILTRGSATIDGPGRARRGASGSLNPQSAQAGPNAARGVTFSELGLAPSAMKARFRGNGSIRTASDPGGS